MAIAKREFLRDATGLVKELSVTTAVIYNFTVLTPGFSFLFYLFYGPISFPGTDLTAALLFSAPFFVLHAFVVGQIMASMPRSGFDYVYISRTLNPALGFTVNWVFVVFQALALGSFFMFINTWSFSNLFSTLGIVYNNAQYLSLGVTILEPMWQFIIGTIILAAIAVFLLSGLRWSMRAIIFSEIIGFASLVLALAVLATTNQQTFALAWDHYFGSQVVYSQVYPVAVENGLVYSKTFGMFFAASLYCAWTVIGYQTSAYLGGEVKRGETNIAKSAVISVIIEIAVLAALYGAAVNAAGYDFVASSAYLNVVGKLTIAPYYMLLVSILFPNPVAIGLLYIGIFFWLFIAIIGILLLLTRCVFAWAFDRIVPLAFAKVSDRTHAPTWATVLLVLITWLGLYLSLFAPITLLVNFMLLMVTAYSVSTLAAAILPFHKKKIFENSPRIVNYKIGGKIPLITITGGITTLFFWFITYSMVTTPAIGGAVTWDTVASMLGVALCGTVIFEAVKYYRKRQGIDMKYLFSEVPPE
jgi:APA family basic amino acid/polyamine antiporter